MNQDLLDLLALYDEEAPLEYAYTIPAAWYTDDRISKLERERVFGANWIAVGRTDQVAHRGQFFTIELAGEPIVVVRGDDGVLRAFYNVCRHHAAAVMTAPCGQAEHLRCPYHGWTYGLDGSLKGAPEFNGVCNFDRAQNGLIPIQIEAWQNFILVNQDPQAAPLSAFPLSTSNLQFFARKTYTLNCNWKVYVDNYLDGGYHVPHLHKSLNSVLDYREYTIENGPNYSLQSSPMVPSEDASVAQTRAGDRAEYYWLYPNFMINLYSGVMDTNLVLPLSQEKCQVVFDFYFGTQTDDQKSASVAVSDQVQIEDVDICESVQRGLSSRAYGSGRLSVRRETGEHLFHRLLAKDLKH
jgi:choline monooxygenase